MVFPFSLVRFCICVVLFLQSGPRFLCMSLIKSESDGCKKNKESECDHVFCLFVLTSKLRFVLDKRKSRTYKWNTKALDNPYHWHSSDQLSEYVLIIDN